MPHISAVGGPTAVHGLFLDAGLGVIWPAIPSDYQRYSPAYFV